LDIFLQQTMKLHFLSLWTSEPCYTRICGPSQ